MGYEKMRVYSAAEKLRRIVDELRRHLRKGFAAEFRHVDEAVDSILNNVAEASDSIHSGKKIDFLDVARNSSNEAGSGLRSLGNRKAFGEVSPISGVTLAFTIRKMLVSLIKQVREGQDQPQPKSTKAASRKHL
jgi:four helix bundle protein